MARCIQSRSTYGRQAAVSTSCSSANHPFKRLSSKFLTVAVYTALLSTYKQPDVFLLLLCRMRALNEKIKAADFNKTRKRYKKLSQGAKNLINGLMHKDVMQRLSAK